MAQAGDSGPTLPEPDSSSVEDRTKAATDEWKAFISGKFQNAGNEIAKMIPVEAFFNLETRKVLVRERVAFIQDLIQKRKSIFEAPDNKYNSYLGPEGQLQLSRCVHKKVPKGDLEWLKYCIGVVQVTLDRPQSQHELAYRRQGDLTPEDMAKFKGVKRFVFDEEISRFSRLIGLPRVVMGIEPMTKGWIFGDVTLEFPGGASINALSGSECTEHPIPFDAFRVRYKFGPNVKALIRTDDHATFSRLKGDPFFRDHAVLVTGSGFCSEATQVAMSIMANQDPSLPVFQLGDGNPSGILISAKEKFGSLSLLLSGLDVAIPRAKFIGIAPPDFLMVRELIGPENYHRRCEPLDKHDVKLLHGLEEAAWFHHPQAKEIRRAVRMFLMLKEKIRMQCFTNGEDFLAFLRMKNFWEDVEAPEN